jgi:hypothetical protein
MNAQGRADDAYGVGQEALSVGHDAKSAALIASGEGKGKLKKQARKARTTQARTNS